MFYISVDICTHAHADIGTRAQTQGSGWPGDSFSDVDDFRALLRTSSEFFRRGAQLSEVSYSSHTQCY